LKKKYNSDIKEYLDTVMAHLPQVLARAKILKYINEDLKRTLPHLGEVVFSNEFGLTITEKYIEIPVHFIIRIELDENGNPKKNIKKIEEGAEE
jgi:hypothetical protein